jgi:hypothetical protein
MSASSKTIKASLPPNSKLTFKIFFRFAAKLAPAASLPVRETPLILLSETMPGLFPIVINWYINQAVPVPL